MQLNRRFPFIQFRPSRVGLRTSLIVVTVFSLVLSPAVALAQEGPNTYWVPPHFPNQVPAAAPEAVATIAAVHDPYPLIIDTDPGVDDAVALAWLLTYDLDSTADTVEPIPILGIVTVAGNTTVENATKNVYWILQQAGRLDVPVVMGAKKPWSEKLNSYTKLIHGPDGIWGPSDPTIPGVPLKNAKEFYCSNATENPGATILALGPLTNIAEAIRHCPNEMRNYERIVVLGGAKYGGGTTAVAEFNIWQDPKSAQVVFEFGKDTATTTEIEVPPFTITITSHKVDVVPLDAYKQLAFTPEELLGISLTPDPPADPPPPPPIVLACPPPDVAMVPNIFSDPSLPDVFHNLAYPVCKYAQTQFFAQFGAPNPTANIPDLVAAIYTIKGLAPVVLPALVEVMERPDAVRGQTIIGLSQAEQIAMVTTDAELDAVGDLATELGILDPNVGAALALLIAKIQTNANIVWGIDATATTGMRGLLPAVIVEAEVGVVDSQADGVEQNDLPERLYLPAVGVD